MHPILIDFGFYALPAYGVMLATAVLVALWTIKIRAKTPDMDPANRWSISGCGW